MTLCGVTWPWQLVKHPFFYQVQRSLNVYAPSQWETTLRCCNIVSHWLGAHTKWSLHVGSKSNSIDTGSSSLNMDTAEKWQWCSYMHVDWWVKMAKQPQVWHHQCQCPQNMRSTHYTTTKHISTKCKCISSALYWELQTTLHLAIRVCIKTSVFFPPIFRTGPHHPNAVGSQDPVFKFATCSTIPCFRTPIFLNGPYFSKAVGSQVRDYYTYI